MLSLPLNGVEIPSPIIKIPDCTEGAGPIQLRELQFGDNQGFDIDRGLSCNAITCKAKIAGSEDTRLAILTIHIGNTPKLTDMTGKHNVALIFNRACLRAVANTKITLSIVGTKWHK